ncbi:MULTISPECIES: hypothetical protein [Ralstonia]|jgi:flagellar export protein FliJ|uniref:Flagellar FliJ protein n=1 Tax=Ralstonia flaminis TaxID=3058597 RepID=A0ABN9JU13_9RALS|nr:MULTISPECIES: hypothetical protein [unclassified Ralstonia]CAJ0819446.1 hypothetical protein LMG18101_03950 [Ralstonia sp. LMG 18101]
MNTERTVAGLSRLAALRAREVDRIGADVAARDAEGARYRRHLAQMATLLQNTDTNAPAHPAHAMNGARYRAALADMIHQHERELAHHDAALASLRGELCAARLHHERIDVVRRKKIAMLDAVHRSNERKREDQQASQAWLRQRLAQGSATSAPS